MTDFISRLAELTVKYLKGELTGHEKEELQQLVNETESNKALFESLTNEEWLFGKIKELSEADTDKSWRKLITAGIIAPRKPD